MADLNVPDDNNVYGWALFEGMDYDLYYQVEGGRVFVSDTPEGRWTPSMCSLNELQAKVASGEFHNISEEQE